MPLSKACLVVLAGCGRLGFDPTDVPSTVASDSLASDAADPLISVDPASLPMFGAATLVAPLSDPMADDDDISLSRDQLEAFFDSNRSGNDDIYTSRRVSLADGWSMPIRIAAIDGANAEEHPVLSRDGLTLYFTSDRTGSADIFVTTRSDRASAFGAPVRVTELDTSFAERMGGIDALDQGLFLSSDRASSGTDRLFEARRSGPGSMFAMPVLVAEIATPVGDPSVTVDDYGLTMYLIQGTGSSDLYWTTRAQVGSPWRTTVPITELNTASNESDPWTSPDQRTIYFVRGTGPGTKDIFIATR